MHEPFRDLSEQTKHMIDGLSIAATLGALLQWLPAVASLLTIVWTLIRIWESRTVQGWIGREQRADCGGGED